jgi:ATP-dependent Lhr-like helicase
MNQARRKAISRPRDAGSDALEMLERWFASRAWTVQPFQREVWAAWAAGRSGLLHAPTGSGKTLAVWGAALLHAHAQPRRSASRLRVLWITPLRALASDTIENLRAPMQAMGLDWEIALRTGDAGSRDRRLARQGKAEVVVTTPESLALMLSYPDTAPLLAGIDGVIVDEWHELLGNKRGVLLQLSLARLRALAPSLRTWGLSATLGNLDEALAALAPQDRGAQLVRGTMPRGLELETVLPRDGERFASAGHLGLTHLPEVLQAILAARSTLLFTNTRAQAELWHQALSAVWPDAPEQLALHHGSLDRKLRRDAEDAVRAGALRCVVATSSLDLGVDFAAVDQVIQVGSAKGVARLLQRAGRSGHRPGASSRLLCVPTHAMELVEFAAARHALAQGLVEPRPSPRLSLDVLAQHLVTRALGGGFDAHEALIEARSTLAFSELNDDDWNDVLDFVVSGGGPLQHYPEYRRVERDDDGIHRVHDRRVAMRHRLSIGTILGDGAMRVKFLTGGDLGTVEETFIGRLRPGDRFLFAGRCLKLVMVKDMTAMVRLARAPNASVPRWMGGRMASSSELSEATRRLLAAPDDGSREMHALAPLLALQRRVSHLPVLDEWLVEDVRYRARQGLFVFAFGGRAVHEALAAVAAMRWARIAPNSLSYAVNDYGFVLSPATAQPVDERLVAALLARDGFEDDLATSLNLGEMARRQFREIARIAGLLSPSLPGRAARSLRQLQASGGLLFDVLERHDPGHVLLRQARRDAFQQQLDAPRLFAVLDALARRELVLRHLTHPSPMSFPLWAERLRGALSNEDWRERVARAAAQLEAKFR